MNDDLIVRALDDTVRELQGKISVISSIAENGDTKIQAVKNKTIEVLQNVLNKIVTVDRNNLDLRELEKGLISINTKSRQLYDNAINKIDQLKKENAARNYLTNESFNSFSKDMENASIEISDMKSVPEDEISRQAISILKGWLIPEGEEK